MLKENGHDIAGKTIAISGAGNVAIYAAEKAAEMGAKVVTLSDSTGWVYDPEGIDLAAVKEIKEVRVSELLVTKPYGGVEQDDFVNGAIALKTLLSPQELLEKLHEIEQHANRERIIHWGPRTLDLDIIFYDKLVYEDEDLIIPHIDMQNRDFVLKPLAELCPNYRHPVFGKTVSQLLGELKER